VLYLDSKLLCIGGPLHGRVVTDRGLAFNTPVRSHLRYDIHTMVMHTKHFEAVNYTASRFTTNGEVFDVYTCGEIIANNLIVDLLYETGLLWSKEPV